MSYDPKRKRKKHAVPPQLKAWVFGRRTHDPKRVSMATGYGSVGRKPYSRGARGGVAWSGGRTLRYDPQRKGWHAKAKGILGKFESNLQWIGLALGVLIPAEVCRAERGHSLYDHYISGTINETQRLFGADPTYPHSPWEYLTWKLTGSPWAIAFWGSLVAQVVTRVGVLKVVSARANTAIKKLSFGTLIASIIGACFMRGGIQPASSNSAGANTNSNVNTPLSYYG